MSSTQITACSKPSKTARVIGWFLTLLLTVFFVLDGVMKFKKPVQVTDAMAHLGYPDKLTTPLGIIVLSCAAIYLFPPTAGLGAILLTGYLGGAVASHLRAGDPVSHVLAPVYFGIAVWLGVLLRKPRMRAIVCCM